LPADSLTHNIAADRHDHAVAKIADHFGKSLKFGGASRARTDDLIVANDALSQLSYSPLTWVGIAVCPLILSAFVLPHHDPRRNAAAEGSAGVRSAIAGMQRGFTADQKYLDECPHSTSNLLAYRVGTTEVDPIELTQARCLLH
jgi:hypothetical protein